MSNTEIPKTEIIGVVIPVHNDKNYIEECLVSVIEQEVSYPFVVIAVMNNCTDDSMYITDKLINSHKNGNKISMIQQNMLPGTTPTRNCGLIELLGKYNTDTQYVKYIANNDSDDVWTDKFKLQKQADFLDNNKDIAIVGGQYIGRDKYGPRFITEHYDIGRRPLEHDECLVQLMNGVNPIGNASAMFRSELIPKIGMYEDLLPLTEDMWFWYKAALAGYKMANLEDTFVLYNVSSNPRYSPAYPGLLSKMFDAILKTRASKK
jgi:glycosyltransferase involved in cell wall biosynthesis